MNDLLGKSVRRAIVLNPFSKSCVRSIRFVCERTEPEFCAYIEFANQATSGKQRIYADDFEQLVLSVKEFLNGLVVD